MTAFGWRGGRLALRIENQLRQTPLDIIRLFYEADALDLEIHPAALREVTRALGGINRHLRHDPAANHLFLTILISARNPELTLRRMNEAGVLGRFIPDFGRVAALMQHDMYHVYTVDEHTLFAIGILHKINNGALADELPGTTEALRQTGSKRALFTAMLLHDIAKGRGGDHSILGAKVAERLCPRLGLTPEESETVAWLVRWHLAMSQTAFKRDLEDPQTIDNFIALVQSPERLRLLLALTVADIRAVGPGAGITGKATLLGSLYNQTMERLSGGVSDKVSSRNLEAAQESAWRSSERLVRRRVGGFQKYRPARLLAGISAGNA